MKTPTPPKPSEKDGLMTRPDEKPLPTTLEPGSDEARHKKVDPRPNPPNGPTDPDANNDIKRAV